MGSQAGAWEPGKSLGTRKKREMGYLCSQYAAAHKHSGQARSLHSLSILTMENYGVLFWLGWPIGGVLRYVEQNFRLSLQP